MEVVTHQPAISIPTSFHFPLNRAGGRTSNVRRLQSTHEYLVNQYDPNRILYAYS